MKTPGNQYAPMMQLLDEISKAWDADAVIAALVMTYVGIDTMAWLSLPIGSSSVRRSDFCAWVGRYLKTETTQAYQYVGIDVYAARCAMLHSYGSLADLHKGANPPKTFGYVDNGPHSADGQLVLVSIAVLIHDFSAAVHAFVRDALAKPDLKARIDSRIEALVTTLTVSPAAHP